MRARGGGGNRVCSAGPFGGDRPGGVASGSCDREVGTWHASSGDRPCAMRWRISDATPLPARATAFSQTGTTCRRSSLGSWLARKIESAATVEGAPSQLPAGSVGLTGRSGWHRLCLCGRQEGDRHRWTTGRLRRCCWRVFSPACAQGARRERSLQEGAHRTFLRQKRANLGTSPLGVELCRRCSSTRR